MRIAIAADHNGVVLKARLAERLRDQGHDVDDRGTHGDETVDYPALCADLARLVTSGEADRAIMVGGTGGGEMIALNRFPGVRAGLGVVTLGTRISRAHNDSNVLVLGTKLTTTEISEELTDLWLETPFKGGRHQERLDQIEHLG
jgi:ribose 5-phosphate isomerase B